MIGAIEVTTRYVATVESLADAFAFVMDRLDLVGPDPDVNISPVWTVGHEFETERHFVVTVSGMIEEEKTDDD